MPTYDYRCDACGHKFEFLQSITEAPLTECPVCGGAVRRLIGAGAGLIFKGSGFYVTDYRKDSSKGEEKSSSKPEREEKKSDGKKTSTDGDKGD
ncbi:MAG: FmdB family zinc ribbon protein [Candidatus Neomarinimicrobiota bacterium]